MDMPFDANGCIDFDVIRGTPLETRHFQFAVWRDVIPPATARRLVDEFPTDHFTPSERTGGGDKTYRFLVRRAVEKGRKLDNVASLSPSWRALIDSLTGPDYLRAVGDKVGLSLANHAIDVGFFVFHPGDDISIHRDHQAKATTNVLYFSPRWEPSWGGMLKLHCRRPDGGFEDILEIPPLVGNAVLLVPSAHSWHSVSAMAATAGSARLTLQVETWRTDSAARGE
jgi:hypothetical protein